MPYNIKESEEKWRDYWAKEKIFEYNFYSDRPTFSLDTPPRYASGKLHIGHAFHYSHMDFVAKYKRLKGNEVYFPLCFDVNGMPIEVNVEKKYGIRMRDYPREEFVKLCEKFADENIDAMTNQFKLLGVNADPSLYYRTDGEYYRKLTQISFIKMYKKGLIYKGTHPVNWCPRCETAIAESEIVYEERDVDLNEIIFKGDDFDIIIATTRPELLPACLAIAVNPHDKRYSNIVGKEVEIPIFGRKVKIIADQDVLTDFGTGAEMVCSVGDKDDLKMIYRHSLPFMKSIDERGKLTEIAGKYAGLDSKEARKQIIEELKKEELFLGSKKISHNVGTCWRCGSPLEFLQKEQWFVKTVEFKEDMKKWANELKWHPLFMKRRLDDWIDSLSWDWVISRQRYFATPIPVWTCENGHDIVANEEQCYVDPLIDAPPSEKCPICGSNLKGSDEVFDTWMDSSISPLFNTFYESDEKLFKKLYPMNLRPQGQDIIRTWAFYSILRSRLLTDRNPWEEIMVDGNIMSPDGRPMHASWGNVIDPLALLDKYGADPFRYFTAQCSLGEDTPFKERDLIRGQRFVNKIHNLVNFLEFYDKKQTEEGEIRPVDHWIIRELDSTINEADEHMANYQYDLAIKKLEDFIWHKFADNYIEAVKHRMNQKIAYNIVSKVLLSSIIMIAPIFPFISEDSYQRVFREKRNKKSIFDELWPSIETYNEQEAIKGESTIEAISLIRSLKVESRIPLSLEISEATVYPIGNYEMDAEDVKNTIRAKELKVINKRINEEIISIKLSPEIYTKLRDKASSFQEYLLNNLYLLKQKEIFYEGMKIETDKISSVKKYSVEGINVSCGNYFCVSIRI
ncbi:MAG: valine--tRNA ligase [Thermoplasmata archaeon]